MAVRLQLNDEQHAALRQVVDRYLSELHDEIAHTDAREFKEDLKRHRALVEEVQAALRTTD